MLDGDSDKGKDIAEARSAGRAGNTLGIFDSPEESDAREEGANEAKAVKAAEKTAEATERNANATEKAVEKDDALPTRGA